MAAPGSGREGAVGLGLVGGVVPGDPTGMAGRPGGGSRPGGPMAGSWVSGCAKPASSSHYNDTSFAL